MKKIILIGLMASIYSCSPTYYIPNTQNVPFLENKDEMSLNAVGNANQLEAQGAYAITDNIGAMVNTAFYNPKSEDDGDGGSAKYLELGGGYQSKIKENFIYEAYGIVGGGSLENHFPSTQKENPNTIGKINSSVLKASIQPAIGYKHKYFVVSVSTRLSYLNYFKTSGDLVFDKVNQLDYLNSNKNHILIEPALTLRAGLEKVKIQIQYLNSFNLSSSNFKQHKNLLTIGLNLNLNNSKE